jgi:general stress protein 26
MNLLESLMNQSADNRSADSDLPDRQASIARLASLIEGIKIAMLTTRSPSGSLVSRPLGTQEVEFDGDLWFATSIDSPKVKEIEADPRVNVAYASSAKNTYVSVSGRAKVSQDRDKIDSLWSPAMKTFFPGGKDDSSLCLIHVEVESAEYWDGPGTALGKALYFVMAAITDNPGTMTDNEVLDLGRKR